MGNGFASVDLAEKIAAGDSVAETELVRRFAPSVYALLFARTRDREACQDLLQDVFVAVLSAVRRGDVRDHQKLSAFVSGVARHVAVTYVRDLARQKRIRPATLGAAAPEGELAVERHERRVRLEHALDRLSPLDREILIRVLQSEELASVAHSLGLTPEAVRQRKHRALKRLAALLHETGAPRDP